MKTKNTFIAAFAVVAFAIYGCDDPGKNPAAPESQNAQLTQLTQNDLSKLLHEPGIEFLGQPDTPLPERNRSLSRIANEAAGITIYVPNDYPTIQSAIDAAQPGATIIVESADRPYDEDVRVNKDGIRLIARDGATVQGRIVIYYSDNVTVANFTVYLDIPTSWGGVSVVYGDNAKVLNNTVFESGSVSGRGIYVFQSTGSIIKNKTSIGLLLNGIVLFYSNDNTITKNRSVGNSEGIRFVFSDNNKVHHNESNKNQFAGLHFSNSSDNNFAKGNISNHNGSSGITVGDNGQFGIYVYGSNTTVTSNNFHCNSGFGDIYDTGVNNTFRDNSTGPLPDCQ